MASPIFWTFSLCCSFFLLGQSLSAPPPIIESVTGSIEGIRTFVADREVDVFLGVPYASPPVGDKRFLKASPLPPFTKPLKATKKSLPCYQIRPNITLLGWLPTDTEFSEDCLYLNIWRPVCEFPEDGDPGLLPIMVWIHGGAFNTGSGNLLVYDGEILAAYGDVIVITINYRVGAMGFLNLGGESVTGNMGISDQEQALTWIRNNAIAFGGDPNRITIFGDSAGSAAVGLHLQSLSTRRLFRRAIMQSFSPTSPVIIQTPKLSIDRAMYMAKATGCLKENSLNSSRDEVLKCLRQLSPEEIVNAETQLLIQLGSPITFGPTYGDYIIPLHPVESLQKCRLKRGELLIGAVEDEGSIFAMLLAPKILHPDLSLPIKNRQEYENAITQIFRPFPERYQKMIADFYARNIQDNSLACYQKAIYDSIGDPYIYCPVLQFAQGAAASGTLNPYFYVFDHRPSNSILPKWMGVAHFDDVRFVFGDPLRNPENYNQEERQFTAAVMTIWVTFATSGRVPLERWEQLSSTKTNQARLTAKTPTIEPISRKEACAFWASLLKEEDFRNIITSL